MAHNSLPLDFGSRSTEFQPAQHDLYSQHVNPTWLKLFGAPSQHVRGTLAGADASKWQQLQIVSEGAVQSQPEDRIIVPLGLALLAGRALDDARSVAGNSAIASNGFGIVGRVVGILAALRFSFSVTGFILFAFAASHAQAQVRILPLNPNPDNGSVQSASLIGDTFDLTGDMARNQTTPDVSAPNNGQPVPSTPVQNDKSICGITRLGRCILDLGEDEEGIFTSPLRLQPKDAYWLAPLGAATGLAFAYDADAAQAAGVNVNRTNTANKIADFGSFLATGAEGAGIYFIGLAQKNPKLAEIGRLSAEAIIDSGSVTLLAKLITNRQRPHQGNGQGDFWAYGTQHWQWDSSFPSDHATASMALARVVSGEYPRWYVMVPAYGFVEAVSISRILEPALSFGHSCRSNRRLSRRQLCAESSRSVSPRCEENSRSQTHRLGHPIADPRSLGASMEIPLGR